MTLVKARLEDGDVVKHFSSVILFWVFLCPCVARGELIGQWTFEETADDLTGHFGPTKMFDGARLDGGQLLLHGGDTSSGGTWAMTGSYTGEPIVEKTLVSWVYIDDLLMPGGGSIGSLVADRSSGSPRFDGMVFGERVSRIWLAGSEGFNRTIMPSNVIKENADYKTLIQIAFVYTSDNTITVYRDKQFYMQSAKGQLQKFDGNQVHMVWGLRHTLPNLALTAAMPKFAGRIEETRLYDQALTLQQIKELEPVQ